MVRIKVDQQLAPMSIDEGSLWKFYSYPRRILAEISLLKRSAIILEKVESSLLVLVLRLKENFIQRS
jgi:hypothetical protein